MDTGFFSIVCLIELFCTLFLLFGRRGFFSLGRFSYRCFFSLGLFSNGCFFNLRRFNYRCFLGLGLLNSGCFFNCRCFLNLGLLDSGCFLNYRSIGSILFGFLQRQHFSSCLVHLFLCIETSLCICTLFLFIFQLKRVVSLLLVVLPCLETSFSFCGIKCTLGDSTQEMLFHQHPFLGKDVAYGVRGLCPCLQPIQSSVEI